jgi:hypothetical protein
MDTCHLLAILVPFWTQLCVSSSLVLDAEPIKVIVLHCFVAVGRVAGTEKECAHLFQFTHWN